MSILEKSPAEARELARGGDDWILVDVRSEQEFAAGHPEGAFNIPIATQDAQGRGLVFNDEFLSVMKASFGSEQRLIMVCSAGIRSMRACEMLAGEGYDRLVNMSAGYFGARGPSGAEEGWAALGFECSQGQPEGHSYGDLAELSKD